MSFLNYSGICTLSYLIGSIPFSQIVASLYKPGIKLREIGCENIGATKVFVNVGPSAGLLALFLDMSKGLAAVFAARALMSWSFSTDLPQILSITLFVLLGHDYSVFMGFKGGKGLALLEGLLLFFGTVWAVLLHLPQAQFLFGRNRQRAMALANILVLLMFPAMSLFWFIESKFDCGILGWNFTWLLGEPVQQHGTLAVYALFWMLMFFMQRVPDTPGLKDDIKKGISFRRAFFLRGLFELFPWESDHRRPSESMPMGEEALYDKKERHGM